MEASFHTTLRPLVEAVEQAAFAAYCNREHQDWLRFCVAMDALKEALEAEREPAAVAAARGSRS